MNIFRIIKLKKWSLAIFVSILTTYFCYFFSPPIVGFSSPQFQVFEQVWQTVNEQFFDPQFNGIDWQAMHSRYAPLAAQTTSTEELADVVNQMLSQLNTSHTHFYTQAEPAYYQIAAIFRQYLQKTLTPFLPEQKLEYTGIGIYTEVIKQNIFIKAILNGSPAEKAGLLVGDLLLSIDGKTFEPIRSFTGKADREVQIQVQRQPHSSPIVITLTPKVFNPATMFLDAMKASVQVIHTENQKIGYIHIWSYANPIYQEQLEQELFDARLKDTDALILDLRDGWGGASPDYLNIFTAPQPTITTIFRDGVPRETQRQWKKPVVLLVNRGSRSGKEILAYGFRKYNLGKIVGGQTAAAVVAGSPFIMLDGSLLYLAVADVFVDGERLEGKGILPDIEVTSPIPYAMGVDPQKERAIEVVLQELFNSN